MKTRNDFVTNSSSSSFICQITGDVSSGWDLSLWETNKYRCENGHVVSGHLLLKHPDDFGDEDYKEYILTMIRKYEKKVNDNPDSNWSKDRLKHWNMQLKEFNSPGATAGIISDIKRLGEDIETFHTDIPAKYCPICQMKFITDDDMLTYLLKTYELTKKELNALMNLKYDGDYKRMRDDLNEK
jgi:hypothetical protein